jgi:hypothetical protein
MAHYHSDDAPEDLKKAIHDGTFVDWYKNASTEQLESALRSVYSHYDKYPLIQKEIDHRQSLPHWTLVPNFWLIVVGTIAGIVAAIMAVRSWEDSAALKSATESLSNHSLSGLQISAPPNQKAPSAPVTPTTNSVAVPASPKK